MPAEKIKYTNPDSFFKKCFDTVLSLAKAAVLSKPGVRLPVPKSAGCVILGNGPSLKQSLASHSEFIKTHDTLCVNSFSVSDEYAILKPAYYVMLDPGLLLSDHDVSRKTFEAIIKKTDWKITLFVPRSASKHPLFEEVTRANKNITIVFFNYTVYRGFRSIGYWLFKNNLAMPQSQNVLTACLFQCINMGYKNIYLLGADHTWHQNLYVNDENVVCFKDHHFYDTKEPAVLKPFYKGLHRKDTFAMHELLQTWSKVFVGYFVLNEYAKYENCTIYNASEVSFIDAFERLKL